jgi:hypothetical protein
VACLGNRNLPALLGHFTIRTGANHENRSRCVRGGCGLELNLAAFAACPYRRSTAMTEAELELHYFWQLYASIVEQCGLEPTAEGFFKFRRTRWTKETCTPEEVRKRTKQCEEVDS